MEGLQKKSTQPPITQNFEVPPEVSEASRQMVANFEQNLKWLDLLKRAAIPLRFSARTFKDYSAAGDGQARALAVAQRYADGFAASLETGRSMMFVGKPGTGKTHLAVAIANKILRKGYSALFASVMQATRRVKECYRPGSQKTETDVIRDFASPDLLILDEVGVQFGSETERMIIFEIINERYENLKPTILISNENEDGLKKYIGERVFDRMLENGGGVLVFDWDSHRSGK